jgi:outer membrane receptor for ferrienterochelin and colicin
MKKRYKSLSILCILSGLCWASLAVAESDFVDLGEGTDEDILFEDIASVYSASKYDQKVTEAPARISIVTAKEIQHYGYRTLADILNSLPGFYINYDRNYGYTGARGFSIAGDYNTKFLQLVDGHRMNDNIYDSAYIDRSFVVDVDLIDRVEVVRGPSSSLYGSSAFFGVVNVITKKGRDLQGFEVSGSASTFDSYQGRLSYGQRFDNGFEVLVSGTYYDSKGDDLYYQEFDDPITNNGIAENVDDENVQNLFAKLSFGDFIMEGAYVNREKGIPTASYDTIFNDSRTRSWEKHTYLDLKYQHLTDSGIELTGRLYYDNYQYDGDWVYDYSDEGDLSDIIVYYDMADGEWWGTEVLVTRPLFEHHKLTLGAEYRDSLQQHQKEWDVYEVYLDEKADDYTYAFFLQDEYKILDDLILNLGLRYDYFDTVGSTTNPRAALIYSPYTSTNLKLLYGTAFRAPNAYELYYHDGDITQKLSHDLESEDIETFEFIVEQELTDNIRAVASIYHNEIEDLIALTTDPTDDLLVFSNLGEAKATGGELQFEGRWDNGWAGSISYSYQYAENKSTGEQLVNSPLNMVKCNVMIPLLEDKLMAAFEAQYESGRKTLDDDKTDDIFLTNLTLLSRNVIKGVTLSASIYNLFDQDYAYPGSEEHYQDSIEQDGRTFRIKLDYAF